MAGLRTGAREFLGALTTGSPWNDSTRHRITAVSALSSEPLSITTRSTSPRSTATVDNAGRGIEPNRAQPYPETKAPPKPQNAGDPRGDPRIASSAVATRGQPQQGR